MIRNMVMGSVGFIGIGEGGCNLVNKFEQLGYKKVFYINSAMKDLEKLDTDPTAIYHIPNASGCVKNRDTAKTYLKENYDIILNNIQQKMSNLKVIFVAFSMGGGTGSGMSPMLINGLINRLPNTTFNTISIVPDSLASATMKYNACECYNELKRIKVNLGNSYFINNDSVCENGKITAKLETIDNSFVSKLHDLMNTSSKDGSVDEAEVLSLLSTNGNTLISEILPQKNQLDKQLILDISLIQVKAGCSYILYSIADPTNYVKDVVEETYGIPKDDFIAYSQESEFVAAFGMAFPEETFKKLKEDCEVIMSVREEEQVEEDVNLDISSLNPFFKPVPAKVKEKAKQNSKDLLDDLANF